MAIQLDVFVMDRPEVQQPNVDLANIAKEIFEQTPRTPIETIAL